MRLDRRFYERDVLLVAPGLIGKYLILNDAHVKHEFMITEVEAYQGIEDQASHARFGKTSRNSVMFGHGGVLYMYFIYGMYWMLNIVTGAENTPQAILIRGIEGYNGPGKLTRLLKIDRSFNGEDLVTSERIWIEDRHITPAFIQTPRIGINYATEPWKSQPWRYVMVPPPQKT
jgi:DNA-3-methyladenine glycosylase